MRAADFRLEEPEVRIAGVMALEEGDSISIRVWHKRQCIAANARIVCDDWYGAGTGWRFLLSTEHMPSKTTPTLDALWMAMLLTPFAFWVRGTPSSAAGGCLIIATLLLVPVASDLLSARLVDWVGAGFGLTIGATLRAWARASVLGSCVNGHKSQGGP